MIDAHGWNTDISACPTGEDVLAYWWNGDYSKAEVVVRDTKDRWHRDLNVHVIPPDCWRPIDPPTFPQKPE